MATTPTVSTLIPGYPIGSNQGHVGFCGVYLIEGTDAVGDPRRIVVDAAHVGRRSWIVRALADRGLRPADVDQLALSHAHWDHVQNLDLFEDAEILLHTRERRYIRDPHPEDDATPRWTSAIIERQRVREVEEGDVLIPGVEILDAPGHSAGTMALAVDTADGRAVVCGDAIQNGSVAAARRNEMVFWNVEEADQTVDKLVTVADVIYPGHDQPFRMDGDKIDYIEPFALTFTNLARETKGLAFQRLDPEARWIMPGIETQRIS
jgi:N-acyl homoserine lactone hydrolase